MLSTCVPVVAIVVTTIAKHFCCKRSDGRDALGVATTNGNTLSQQLPAHLSVVRDIIVAVLKLLQVIVINVLVTEALKLTGGRCVLLTC